MTDPGQLIEEHLARLASATKNIHPRQGFEKRVLLAVSRSAVSDWRQGLWRIGRYGLVLAAVTLVLATTWAIRGTAEEDEVQAVAYGTVDFEW
jgi:hypothetical protein